MSRIAWPAKVWVFKQTVVEIIPLKQTIVIRQCECGCNKLLKPHQSKYASRTCRRRAARARRD